MTDEQIIPRIVITVEGGLIQKIISDTKIEVVTLDYDTEGTEEDEITNIDGKDCFYRKYSTEDIAINKTLTDLAHDHTERSNEIRERTLPYNKQVKAYVDNGGTKCLYCNAMDIEGSNIDINDGIATQIMACNACGKKWVDIYKLKTVDVFA